MDGSRIAFDPVGKRFLRVSGESGYTITIEEIERKLIARKRELGITGVDFLPRNDGLRRTESKRRLLEAIADSAAEQGIAPRFKANIGR